MHKVIVSSYFSAGHFLSDEPIHGHNYGIRVILKSELENGMVEDFRIIQRHLDDFCKTLDHYLLIPGQNKEVKIDNVNKQLHVKAWERTYVLPASDVVILPVENTTAELLAKYAHAKLKEKMRKVVSVQIDESPNCTGEYSE
ncbi:6-carboxytetrahydropterin synthase [Candidatus Micrarchaeota archaeon]|nr:6-carboxytetrahydropterin synthase [Candidatus Micrarchaeota archaeon]